MELNQVNIPVHGVFGNNDGDRYLLTKLSLQTLTNITLHGLVGQIDIDGFHIAFTHQGIVGEALASGNNFKMVCYGHSHEYLLKDVGRTILLNPGEIMGKDGLPGFCFVDTNTGKIIGLDIQIAGA